MLLEPRAHLLGTGNLVLAGERSSWWGATWIASCSPPYPMRRLVIELVIGVVCAGAVGMAYAYALQIP